MERNRWKKEERLGGLKSFSRQKVSPGFFGISRNEPSDFVSPEDRGYPAGGVLPTRPLRSTTRSWFPTSELYPISDRRVVRHYTSSHQISDHLSIPWPTFLPRCRSIYYLHTIYTYLSFESIFCTCCHFSTSVPCWVASHFLTFFSWFTCRAFSIVWNDFRLNDLHCSHPTRFPKKNPPTAQFTDRLGLLWIKNVTTPKTPMAWNPVIIASRKQGIDV